ncbi:MAG: hypothetical protein J6X87_00625, partial [Clostridia bacterium]|nr:hypothetical protein [Clostridia bacterium]
MAPSYHVKACVFRTKATFCEAKLETEWKHTGFIARAANVKLRRFEVRKWFASAKPETKRRYTRVRAKQAAANLSQDTLYALRTSENTELRSRVRSQLFAACVKSIKAA